MSFARRLRCMWYNDDGSKRQGEGCRPGCEYVHPGEPGWNQAKRTRLAHPPRSGQSTFPARGHGRDGGGGWKRSSSHSREPPVNDNLTAFDFVQSTLGSQSPASSTTSKKDTSTSDANRAPWGSTSAGWDPSATSSSDNVNPWENGGAGWGSSASTSTWGNDGATWGTTSTDKPMDVDPAPTTSNGSPWGASSSKDTSTPWDAAASSSSSANNTSQATSASMDTSWGAPSTSTNSTPLGDGSSWGQPRASTSTLDTPSWSAATVEPMQVDSVAPSNVDKGKGREVDYNPSSHASGSKPSLPHRKSSSIPPQNTDSPDPTRVQDRASNRERSPSHAGSDNSNSTVSTIPTNPQDIHVQWIKTFLRLLRLVRDRDEAQERYEHWCLEKDYPSVQMTQGVDDDLVGEKDRELREAVTSLNRKIEEKEALLNSLPEINTDDIPEEVFEQNAQTVQDFLGTVQKWVVDMQEAEKEAHARALAKRRDSASTSRDVLPSLVIKPWPEDPSFSYITRRLHGLVDHYQELSRYFEDDQFKGADEYFEDAITLSDRLEGLRLDRPPHAFDRDSLSVQLAKSEAALAYVESELKQVRVTTEASRESLRKSQAERDELKTMKEEVEKRVLTLEEAEKERRRNIANLSSQVMNLEFLKEQPPLQLLDPVLKALAESELNEVMPLVAALETQLEALTKESANRVAANIDQYIAPTLAKVKSFRVRAHSLGYNGK
ncbi:hypothetical protein BDZ89DRAFT_1113007 [Hymenopellis radicata]|nr:hypothetical protein BDZ89DRAFT_1113007 [Hymenopellis radicata]